MRALSIRQPYAELILRGLKTVEYRSRPTKIIGERFYIYAAKGFTTEAQRALTDDGGLDSADLLRGVLVGTATISHITNGTPGVYEWHLTDVRRLARPRKPKRMPQPVWFRPF